MKQEKNFFLSRSFLSTDAPKTQMSNDALLRATCGIQKDSIESVCSSYKEGQLVKIRSNNTIGIFRKQRFEIRIPAEESITYLYIDIDGELYKVEQFNVIPLTGEISS